MYRFLFLFLVTFSFSTCKNTNSSESATNDSATDSNLPQKEVTKEDQKVIIYAWVDKLRIRKEPNTKSPIVDEVAEGTALTFLNEKTDFTQKISMRGTLFDEPWLKVVTNKDADKVGWVYGGGVKFYKPDVDANPSPYDKCLQASLKGQIDKAQSCFDAIEKKQLQKDSKFVRKTANGFKITLLNGKKEVLTNVALNEEQSNSEKSVDYSYRYYLDRMGYFVFNAQHYEGNSHFLMNDKSAKITLLWGFPKASPDFKHIVATSADLDAGYNTNGIQILGFTDSGLEVLFSKKLDEYEPHAPQWMDNKTIELTLVPPAYAGGRKKTAQLLMDDKGEWSLKE